MARGLQTILLAASILLASSVGYAFDEGKEAAFALIIGSNSGGEREKPALRYADDDAALSAKLMTQLGAKVVLLTTFDTETAQLHPDLSPAPATKEAVTSAMDLLNQRIEESTAAGKTTSLYLFYSGHGDVEHNHGFVNLDKGRLERDDLVELLERSSAHTNHVIIDACNSYFMVFPRGAGGTRTPVQGMADLSQEGLPDNTGVFLSTSSAADSHEWEALQSGIFSHEIRSAMRGAADLNLDGKISYTEAAAFVWTANGRITNRRLRPKFYSRPPTTSPGEDPPLASLSGVTGDRLHVDAHRGEHAYLEDAMGLRLADLHPADGQRVVLLIPSRRPLFLRQAASAHEYEIPKGSTILLGDLDRRHTGISSRGAEHEAFGRLFEESFGEESLDLYRGRPQELFDEAALPRDLTFLRRSLGFGAFVTAGAGAVMTTLAVREKRGIDERTDGVTREQSNEKIKGMNIGAITCYAVAGTLLGAYISWTLAERNGRDSNVSFVASPSGALELTVEF